MQAPGTSLSNMFTAVSGKLDSAAPAP